MAKVMITGGSRGIGAAAVRRFAAAGHRVFFLYEKAHESARAVAEETGATAICADVADEAQVKEAFRQSGSVDILVCNAGISLFNPINMTSSEQWDRIFDVNVKGIYHCVNAAIPASWKSRRAPLSLSAPCGARWAPAARRHILPPRAR